MKTTKKELILEGLNCADCSIKIENALSKIEDINTANINFIDKSLSLNIKNKAKMENILNKTHKIIKRIEPDIIIKEKKILQDHKQVFMLFNLCCEVCSGKVEKEIRNIDGVKNINIDYEKSKMYLEIYSKKDSKRIMKESKKTASSIIKGIKIKEEKKEEDKSNLIKNLLLVLGIVSFIFMMLLKIPYLRIKVSFFTELIVFIFIYLILAYDIIIKSFKNIIRGQIFDENFLMMIASIGAFAIKEFHEAVAVIIFYKIGLFLENLAVNHSRKSIKSLITLRPDYANIKQNSAIKKISPEDVKIGDIIVVKPGEKIPLDGIVIEGKSMVDTSQITGESVLKEIKQNEEVLSGFINKNSLLTIEVKKEYHESTIARIQKLIEDNINKKSKSEKFITKFAKYYTPFIVLAAVLIAVIPALIFQQELSKWIYRGLVFLVVSCPCALVISIPLGFFGGIGASSKKGILIKGSNYLDSLNNVDTIVFDKTGTLTKGVFKVTNIKTMKGFTEEQIIKYAAYAEYFSTHPIAESIKNHYSKKITESKIGEYNEIAGFGIKTYVDKKEVIIGKKELLEKNKIEVEQSEYKGTTIFLSINKKFSGSITISDEIKQDAETTIQKLNNLGIKKIVMLTGDNKTPAEYFGKKIGITDIRAELLPEDKTKELEKLEYNRRKKSKIMFIGDGVNDAPVIARADIGVAMGNLGSDITIETADIVLMTDELKRIPTSFKIAKKTKRIVWQNIIFAFVIKILILLLGVLGIATMWAAVFADVGVAILAVLNAMRILKIK